ncbi:hypothetical protein BH11CYA1_BH11CYA1_24920 [soil metagenome]
MTACNNIKLVLLASTFLCFGCSANSNTQVNAQVNSQAGAQFAPQVTPQGNNQSAGTIIGAAGVPFQVDDTQIIQAQSQQARKVELTVTAPIEKLLREEDYREPHQRFLLALSNGTSVLVANDLEYGTFAPVQAGNIVRIKGEYIWNERGGVLHWTHKSDEPRHESGYIDFNGMRYQ